MTDLEGFASNETLMQAFLASVEIRPDEDCVPDQDRSSSCEKNLRTNTVSDGSLGLPSNEAMLEEEVLNHLANDFVARVIQEYERVLERGLPPSKAIASVVGWASGECQRIRA
jgi:hypothetical protein